MANPNTITVTDPVLSGIFPGAQIPPQLFWFGSGVDGDVTLNADTNYTAVKEYNNLTINAGFFLTLTSTYPTPIFVKDTLTLGAGAGIRNNGLAGTDATTFAGAVAGAAPSVQGFSYNGAGTGGAGQTTNGSAGSGVAESTSAGIAIRAFSSTWSSGKGGNSGANTGGAAASCALGTALVAPTFRSWPFFTGFIPLSVSSGTGRSVLSGMAGASGGGGAGDGTNKGGGGGSGGHAGGPVVIHARNLVISAGAIQSIGGRGGNGAPGQGGNAGGGGGGAGGSGGLVVLIYETLDSSTGVDVSAGGIGTGGAGVGSGLAGDNGVGGPAGLLIKYNIRTGNWE
jgi:hypothetical protein